MRTFALLVALTTLAWAQRVPELPKPIDLKQTPARSRAKLRLPKGHSVGPAIPGLKQGAIPQGLAFWQQQNWFLISCYFDHKEGESPRKPSVVVAIDAQTRKVVRSLTLLEASGKGHTGHVGGVAVSDTYLWVGSGKLYRVPLADILAAKKVDYLRLQKPFQAETNASYVAYHNKRVWVGEFVSIKDPKFKGKPAHYVKDRSGEQKHAWICGYALDADENLATVAGNKPVPPVVLSVRDHVQGLAFQQGNIILSTSYGRTKDSHLVVHKNPFPGEAKKPHKTVKIGDVTFPVWFLDGKNKVGKQIPYPPMSEGITAYGKRLAVICESGAEKFKKKGHVPLDNIIFLKSPGKKK